MPGTEEVALPSEVIRAQHAEAIRKNCKRTVSDTVDTGRRLIEVKRDHCAHGEWLPWLETEFGWTERTAQRFMIVADLAAKNDTVSDLDIPLRSLYALAAPSTKEPIRQVALEAIANGEKVTPADIREMVNIAKPILDGQGEDDDEEEKAKRREAIAFAIKEARKGGPRPRPIVNPYADEGRTPEWMMVLGVIGNARRIVEDQSEIPLEYFDAFFSDAEHRSRGIASLKAARDVLSQYVRMLENDRA
jgi:hypothetical protein